MQLSQRTHLVEVSALRMHESSHRGEARPAVDQSEEVVVVEKAKLAQRRASRHAKADDDDRGYDEAPRGENLVEDLMHQWILSPEEKPAPPSDSSNAAKCNRRFRKGEIMYACPKCGYDDGTVFCSDCFDWADHQDHGAESIVTSHDEAFCDCGHFRSVRRPMTCVRHGTRTPKDYE